MAFLIPAAIVKGIIGGQAALAGGTMMGTALSAWSNLKHYEAEVADISQLQVGDHVTYLKRHGIIVVINQKQKGEVGLIIYSSSVVKTEKINAETIARDTLTVHSYEPLICFPKPVVAARAKSLSLEYSSSQIRNAAVSNFWSFFRNDQGFADWCHIGHRFTDTWLGKISFAYTNTYVADVGSIREGDHVRCELGWTGIVTTIDSDGGTANVLCFQPGTDKLVNKTFAPGGKMYRYDYDIAVGMDNQFALAKAVQELENPTEPRPYTNGEEFAMWCKTQLNISANDASNLARSRMSGRVWSWVTVHTDISVGDHIAYSVGYISYRHAVIVDISGNIILCIDRPSDGNSAVREIPISMEEYLESKKLCKYFYPCCDLTTETGEVNETVIEEIVNRARSYVGQSGNQLPFKDGEHFAMYCRSGSYQLHQ